jgi:hypothetical protein
MIWLLALVGAVAWSPPDNRPIWAMGAARQSCATSWQEENSDASYAWVMGYWTGLNAASGQGIGRQTDGNGIVGEVKLLCKTKPSLDLLSATTQVYLAMEKTAH